MCDERQDEQAQRGNEVDLCVAEAFAQVALREERADRDHRDGRIERSEIGDRRCRNDRQLERRQKAEQADEVGNDAGIDKGVAEALRTRHITGKLTYAVGPEQQVVHHDERRAEEQTLRAVQCVEQRQTHEAAVGEQQHTDVSAAKLACEPFLRKTRWLTRMLSPMAVHVHRTERIRALPSAGSNSR